MARGGGGFRGGGSRGGSRGGGGFSSRSSRSSRGFSSASSSRSRGGIGGSGMNRGGGFGGPTRRPSSGPGHRGPIGGPRPPRPHRPHRPYRRPIFIRTPRPYTRTVYRSGSGSGCMGSVVSMVALLIILMVFFAVFSGVFGNRGGSSNIVSSVEREPLTSGSVNETGYFTDNLGLIESTSKLTGGMKKFYQETGVQPYLYLASEAEVDAAGGLEVFTETMYDELFTDEAHFLFAYTEDQNFEWEIRFVVGSQATAVIDTEAEDIIYQHFVRYYEDWTLEDEEFFSKVFEESAKVMMKHETNGFDVAKVALLVVGGIAIVGLIIYGVNKNRKLKLEKQKEQNEFTEKMMNVPLEKFGDVEADKELDDLLKKYKENQSE